MNIPPLLYSYIDPVSGVILLQLAIGGCIGGFAFFFRKIGAGFRFLNLFRSKTEAHLQIPAKSASEEK
jgi:hypothetical protein